MNVSPWRQHAMVTMDPELIKVILDLQHVWVDHWGTWPTVAQILKQIQKTDES